MKYRQIASRGYDRRKPKFKPPKTFYPKGVKNAIQRRFYKIVSLKHVGDWSSDLSEDTVAWKILEAGHLENVKKVLAKEKPKNKTELEKALKKAVNTPQQRFVCLYELSLRRPLTDKEFHEYMELFRQIFPKHWQMLYGKKTVSQVIAETISEEARR
jgi:hypothetical protein